MALSYEMSLQQPGSNEDEASVKNLSRKLEKPEVEPTNSGLQGAWPNHSITEASVKICIDSSLNIQSAFSR